MKVLQFPLAKVTLWFIGGIVLCNFAECKPITAFGFLALSFSFLTGAIRFSKLRLTFGIAVCIFSFCFGIITLTVHNHYFNRSNYIHHIKATGETHRLELVLRQKLKSTTRNDRYVALVNQIDSKSASGKMLLNFRKDNFRQEFKIGTLLYLKGKIDIPKQPINPDQFDYGRYLVHKSILAQMYVDGNGIQISNIFKKDAFYYADEIRNRIINNLKKIHFGKSELAVIAALILGQQQDISADVLHDYQFAGAIHILSVSGLHVGFILLFLNFGLRYLPNNRVSRFLKLIVILLGLWGFAMLAGLSPSVIRSVTMFSFVAVGMQLKRQTNVFHTLLVSMLLILLFEPSFLFDIGFQLSYLALFFILWLQPLLSKIWTPGNKIFSYLWSILTVSFAAQIGTLPLSIYYFHQFPGLFFVTNLVVIPFLGIIMALGVLVMVLAAFNIVPEKLAFVLEWSIRILNLIINRIASIESFIFQDLPFNTYMLLTLYLLLISGVLWLEKPDFKKSCTVLIALLVFQSAYFGTRWMHRNESEWLVFNVRKSSLIVERNGEKVTVFTDNKDSNEPLLRPFLIANFCKIESKQPIKNTVYFHSKKILLIDSLAVFPKQAKPDILLLRQSPKINLDRLLQLHKPKIIIADASNYKTYVSRWKETCVKQKIPFHATAEKGFYRLK